MSFLSSRETTAILRLGMADAALRWVAPMKPRPTMASCIETTSVSKSGNSSDGCDGQGFREELVFAGYMG